MWSPVSFLTIQNLRPIPDILVRAHQRNRTNSVCVCVQAHNKNYKEMAKKNYKEMARAIMKAGQSKSAV